MLGGLNQLGKPRALKMFADWTDRIAAGEFPKEAPPRPQGVERNVVITQWDWADPKAYLHDEIATDKRNPTAERQRPDLRIARREPRFPAGARSGAQHHQPGEGASARSEYAAAQPKTCRGRRRIGATKSIWDSQNNVHNPMFDEQGRVWFTSRIRGPDNPALCKEGSQPSFGEAHAGEDAPAASWRCTIRRPSSCR